MKISVGCAATLVVGISGCGGWKYQPAFDRLLAVESSVASGAAETPEGPKRPKLADAATLSEYLAYAASHHPGLRSAFERFRAALEAVPQARSLPDPQLTFGAFISPVETRVGPQQGKVGLSQMFPAKGRRSARAAVALRAGEAALAQYEAMKLGISFRVKEAYWRYWYLSRSIAATEENLRLLENLEGVARQKFAAGTASNSAVIKAQVELGKLEDRLKSLEDLRLSASARLSAALGRDSAELLPWPATPPEETAVDVSYAALIADLERRNPELRAAGADIARAEALVETARLAHRPDLMIGLEYILVGERAMAGVESGEDAAMASFGLSLPFANRHKYAAAEHEAAYRLSAATSGREEAVNRLSSELQMALYDFRDSERKIDLYRDTLLAKARQALEVTREGFQAGRADFLDLIDAERTLLEFELSHAKAQADRVVSLAKIEMLVGRDGGAAAATE
jgi:cobalt-zinc-cadmium efflux system outer membrane protein